MARCLEGHLQVNTWAEWGKVVLTKPQQEAHNSKWYVNVAAVTQRFLEKRSSPESGISTNRMSPSSAWITAAKLRLV